jgi:hypothetical protein
MSSAALHNKAKDASLFLLDSEDVLTLVQKKQVITETSKSGFMYMAQYFWCIHFHV